MEAKKEYYFSYDRVHRWLNILKSANRSSLHPDISDLSLLCSEIRLGSIGDYNEVEWNRFGINADSIPTLLGENFRQETEPCPAIEIVRVLVYWRDHAREVLADDSDSDEISRFEEACCNAIEKLSPKCKDEYMNQLKEELGEYASDLEGILDIITFGDKLYLKSLKEQQETWKDYFESEEWKIIYDQCLEGTEMVLEGLFSSTEHSPFPYPFIVLVAYRLYLDILRLIDKGEDPDMDKIFRDARGLFVHYSGRYIKPTQNSITLALWLLVVILQVDRGADERRPEKNELYIDWAKRIASEVEHHPHGSYHIHELFEPIDDIVKKILAVEDAEGEENIASSVAPDDSLFLANSMGFELCKEKLLSILNNSSTKLEVCRKLKDKSNAIYFNMEHKRTDLARILNTWVPLITNSKNKKWEFTDDDFRKA